MSDEAKVPPKIPKAGSFLKWVFSAAITITVILSGALGSWYVQRHFDHGTFVPEGVSTAFQANIITFPGDDTKLAALGGVVAKAKSEILVMANVLSSKRFIDLLANKAKSGVKVIVILNKSSNQSTASGTSPAEYMVQSGVQSVNFDNLPSSNQLILIDKRVVIISNAAFSSKAEATAGTILVLDSPDVAKQFRDYFRERLHDAQPLITTPETTTDH